VAKIACQGTSNIFLTRNSVHTIGNNSVEKATHCTRCYRIPITGPMQIIMRLWYRIGAAIRPRGFGCCTVREVHQQKNIQQKPDKRCHNDNSNSESSSSVHSWLKTSKQHREKRHNSRYPNWCFTAEFFL